MLEPVVTELLATMMVVAGDILAIIATIIPLVVCGGVAYSAIGRVSFREIMRYWLTSLGLIVLLTAGIIAKVNSTTLALDNNGFVFAFTNQTITALLGVALFFLIAAGGILLYIWNK